MTGPITPSADAGYLRVSTEAQLDGFGLEVQRAAVVELAAHEGRHIAAWFVDEGVSGSEGLDTRAGLAAALEHLCEHVGATIIVPRLDRLARDLMVQEQVLADVWRAGGHVLSCSETERTYCRPDDPSDPARTLIRQVLGAVAAYERAMIRLRLVRGRRMRLVRDGWAGGPVPYGWDDPAERAVLVDIDEHRRAGVSWRRLATVFAERGVVKRNGKPWNAGELQRTHARALERGPITPGTAMEQLASRLELA
jgi:DNA invertase Pin-like site-specific DNA recombinase